jgi:hypothetical protein
MYLPPAEERRGNGKTAACQVNVALLVDLQLGGFIVASPSVTLERLSCKESDGGSHKKVETLTYQLGLSHHGSSWRALGE